MSSLLCLASLLILAIPVQADPPITAAAFAPDGRLVTGSQTGLRFYSWPTLKLVDRILPAPPHVHDLAFAPAGDILAVAGGSPGEAGLVELLRWPSRARLPRLEGHTDLVLAVAWSQDGRRLVSASADGTCRVFDARAGKHLVGFTGHAGAVRAITFLPDSKAILSGGSDQSLRLWDAASGKILRVMENHTAPVHALALRPGQPREALPLVASAGADRTVRLWQPSIGRMMRFNKLPAPVLALAWTLDGSQLLAGGTDGRLRVLDPGSLEVVHEAAAVTGWLYTLALPSKGTEVLAGGEKAQLARLALPGQR